MAKKTAAERKPPKLPKSLGACVDLYHDMREERLELSHEVDARKKDEAFVTEHLINSINKNDDGGAVGKRYKAVVKTEQIFQAEDWDKLYAYIKKNDAFDILNRALNQAALKDRIDALNEKVDLANAKIADPKARKPRKLLPGLTVFNAVKLSVTKV